MLHDVSELVRRGMKYAAGHGWRAALRRAAALPGDPRFPTAGSYEKWLARRRPPGGPAAPLTVSVLVPVRDPQPAFLAALVRSVLEQDHRDLELILADDGSTDPEVRALLAGLAGGDPRVTCVATGGAGISAATNAAAARARGEVLAFADHDDLLAEGVLGAVARAFHARPALDLLTTDEDMLDGRGRRVCPSFRPLATRWLSLGFNCGAHLLCLRRRLFHALGGLRSEYDGAQDHDLLLRAVEVARGVEHLPLVGYHWRRAPGSVAASSTAKPWAYDAGRRAVKDACRRRGLRVLGVDTTDVPGVYRVEPSPVERASPVDLLVHGPAAACRRWFEAPLPGLVLAERLTGRWPPAPRGRALLVVDARSEPDPAPLLRTLAWLQQPGVQAVAGVAQVGRRRLDAGWAVDRSGMARAILPGTPWRAVGPSLLAAAPREVAAGGTVLLALAPGLVAHAPAGTQVVAEDLLAFGLLASGLGAPLLMDPRAALRLSGRAGPAPVARELGGSAFAARILVTLAREAFDAEGADPYCPRADLLEPLGVPGPR